MFDDKRGSMGYFKTEVRSCTTREQAAIVERSWRNHERLFPHRWPPKFMDKARTLISVMRYTEEEARSTWNDAKQGRVPGDSKWGYLPRRWARHMLGDNHPLLPYFCKRGYKD